MASILKRSPQNPIFKPEPKNQWGALATFNGSVVKTKDRYHLLYRAQANQASYLDANLSLSSIGHAISTDGLNFTDRQKLIFPEHEWELFGCEDPRVTELDGKYFISYTALSTYPFTPQGIRIGLGITKDFQKIEAKHLITPFNAKAMALFPEKIKGQFAAVLTVHTDIPPAKIALAFFDKEEEIWSRDFWENWYASLDNHVIPLLRNLEDQLEIGTAPLKTNYGWLLFHSYIKNYFSSARVFGIEAILLDLDKPQKIIGRTTAPLLIPEEEYELRGNVPNVIFPSGAIIKDEKLLLYYGAADTTCCLVTCPLIDLIKEIKILKTSFSFSQRGQEIFQRFDGNPIISPIPEFAWEARATFNPAAISEGGRIHLLYRAVSPDNTSTLGYASSKNGLHFEERSVSPVYTPREDFEKKAKPYISSGCEDPRLTKIGDRIYMCYTAFDGKNPPRVGLNSIAVGDFLTQKWSWRKSKLISPPGVDDKDAFILPEKINGQYLIFHRIGLSIWLEKVEDLNFRGERWLGGEIFAGPRKGMWDSLKIGVAAPAIKTEKGWLLFYHGVSEPEIIYKVGALLLDLKNPEKVLGRTKKPLFEPKEDYEKEGQVPNVVFPCGAVLTNQEVLIYYGGADQVIGVASANLTKILKALKSDA